MKKILIANRGEIASRIIRTAREMGILTVAIYSDADRNAPFVKQADQAIHIGKSPSSESYLVIDKILDAARQTGAEGIHPGYGFLSENATFAKEVAEAGLIFIGPSLKAIRTMGSKLAAKEAVKAFNIPMVPGTENAIKDIEEAKIIASKIGFPILIKASGGGGGKGMRIVYEPSEIDSQMERAISEAESAFGDGSVFIEKYIEAPRHIEIQVLADTHGNIIHLFERECSIQRRHQKVIEESPSPFMTEDLRKVMGAAAVNVARSCDYVGAGTVEFLVDNNRNFYFLEMNTRLQVEHPVTEFITGVDLVEQQIRVANGEKLKIKQKDLSIDGHAIELRVYAEDPANDFLPSVGHLERYRVPTGENVRVDDGYEEGMDVPIFYDPMLSKLVVHAKNRKAAIQKMKWAIDHYEVKGVETTLPFGAFVMDHPVFQSGQTDTHFVQNHFTGSNLSQENKMKDIARIGLAVYLHSRRNIRPIKGSNGNWNNKKSYTGDNV